MANIVLGVGILLMFDCASLSVNGHMRDFPGPYCEQRRGGCCDLRKDECSVPISSKINMNFNLWFDYLVLLALIRHTVMDCE